MGGGLAREEDVRQRNIVWCLSKICHEEISEASKYAVLLEDRHSQRGPILGSTPRLQTLLVLLPTC